VPAWQPEACDYVQVRSVPRIKCAEVFCEEDWSCGPRLRLLWDVISPSRVRARARVQVRDCSCVRATSASVELMRYDDACVCVCITLVPMCVCVLELHALETPDDACV
jgi:hypothetical protein